MSLCTLANVKSLLGLASTDATRDALIERLIAGVSRQMAKAAGRPAGAVEYASGRIEHLAVSLPRTTIIWVAAFPVIEVTEVKEAVYGGFDGVDALTADEDYQLDADIGALHRIGWWLTGVRTVRVTYAGGYTPAEDWVSAGTYVIGQKVLYGGVIYSAKTNHNGVATLPSADTTNWDDTEEVAVDDDIRDKAAKQAAFYYQRRGQLGLISAGAAGGSFSTYAKDDLLPDVRAAAETLRRQLA